MMFGKIGANNAYAVGDKTVDDAVALSVKYPYRWMAKEVSGVQADNWYTLLIRGSIIQVRPRIRPDGSGCGEANTLATI